MTFNFTVVPAGDVENDGWTYVSADATRIWEILGHFEDDCFIRCPSYRGGISVRFPTDVEDLPAGAIIDSITVFIRMKTNAGSGPRAVTVNVRSRENRSRYTTRTLYADNTFTTYEVATYQNDPLGHPWTIHRLNKLELRIFSRNDLFDSVQISQLYIKVNFHTRPTVAVTAPTGTVFTPSPTVAWNYSQEEGEPQSRAEYKVFTAAQVETATFSPITEPPIFRGEVQGERTDDVLPTSLNPDDYYVYVKVYSQFEAGSEWVGKAFTVQGPAPGVPGDDNAGIAGTPGIGRPSVVPDSFTSSAVLKMRDSSNLLSVQQADFEIATDPVEYTGTNCTPVRTTERSFPPGVASLKILAESTADTTASSTLIEIAELSPLVGRAQVRASSTARTVTLTVDFYDADFSLLAGSLTASGSDSSSTWTEFVTAAGSSPASTRYAKVSITVAAQANGEVHYVDHVGLMYGADTAWSDGGHVSHNMLSAHLATGDGPVATNTWITQNSATTVAQAAVTGTGSHGTDMMQMTAVAVAASIGHRATGTVFTTPTSGLNYTLNKPAGVADNDLLLAFVTSNTTGGILPPTGWTFVNSASIEDVDGDIVLHVLKKTGLAADPATWTDGELDVSSTRRTAVVVAYSGAANSDAQFISESIALSGSGDLIHQTAVVSNNDPNAWRVAAFAASDNASGANFTANEDAPVSGDAGDISYVGPSNHWINESAGTTFTINKPDNVQEGDLLLASVGLGENFTSANITPPSGWTIVRVVTQPTNTSEGGLSMAIMGKTAGAGEPNSWSGSTDETAQPRMSQCVAYRGADDFANQFIDEDESDVSDHFELNTATITNTDSKAWRLSVWAALTPSGDNFPSYLVTENKQRNDNTTSRSGIADVAVSMWDSNGPVGTGDHKRKGEIQGSEAYGMTSWIALIKPLPAEDVPAPGAGETERVDNNNGSSDPWISTAVYDSNGVAPVGSQSLYGAFDPGTGSDADAIASWIGIIRPATAVEAGVVAAKATSPVEISNIDPLVMDLAENKVTLVSSFLGSSAGVPMLKVGFYQANQLLSEAVATGTGFNSSFWVKSWAEFSIPEGTTRIMPILGAYSRAVGDTVSFDRVGLMLGGLTSDEEGGVLEPVWRNGTSRDEHPVWSVPVFECADDDGSGYGPFEPLAGQKINPPFYGPRSGQLEYVDHTIVPLNNRRYRVQTLSYGLSGDTFASGFGPESEEAAFGALNWWLKDLRDLSLNMQLKVKAEPLQVGTVNTAAVFQPLGEDYPIVISEGYKADGVQLTMIMNREEHADLKRILNSRRTLLLQSDIDHSWWVRAVGNLEVETQLTAKRTVDPLRFVKVTFIEVKPEE